MSILLLHIDAFTDEVFSGNPAAVCLLPPPSKDAWKQALAAEMNLSETCFVERAEDSARTGGVKAAAGIASDCVFQLRWFTPKAEVPLCGHATLAAAHALWEEGIISPTEEIGFDTLSGRLRARLEPDGITLDFPAMTAYPSEVPAEVAAAIGVPVGVQIGVPIVAYGESKTKLLVELESEAAVRGLSPDMGAMLRLPKEGVIVTARADAAAAGKKAADFVSRFFAPKLGVAEDPVTGSSHCVLGPWWAEKLGKTEFYARQVSARGGAMQVRLEGDRVYLTGRAVTVTRGTLSVEPQ
jgi:PhzF family phenazine biosynthesis protein